MALLASKVSSLSIPRLGFGSGTAWFSRGLVEANSPSRPARPEYVESYVQAIKVGYRHIDAAEM